MKTPINIETVTNVKLNARVVFFSTVHELAYEGPCRFGKLEDMKNETDMLMNKEVLHAQMESVKKEVPDFVELLEPRHYKGYTDNWRVSANELKELCIGSEETDVYIVAPSMASGDLVMEFALMAKRPIIVIGNDIGIVQNTATLLARGVDASTFMHWSDARQKFRILRAKKILSETRVMCISRFNGNRSSHCSCDSFVDLEKVTHTLGSKFRFVNFHEFVDQLQEIDPTQNYTTPGRRQENINEKDMAVIHTLADELISNATKCEIERDELIRSLKTYYLIQKLMEKNECNALSAICPDGCSTCRLNENRFTWCISHSLNEEQGIPSACEYDLAAVISKAALLGIANKPTYMGNTNVLTDPSGRENSDYQSHFSLSNIAEDRWEELSKMPNLIATGHSVANRFMNGFDESPSPYALSPFAYSGFGATVRCDFSEDTGKTVTMCRFSPNCDKLLVSKGTIVEYYGENRWNCTFGAVIQVENSQRFFESQIQAGNHVPFVYGDYFDDMVALGKELGLEVLIG